MVSCTSEHYVLPLRLLGVFPPISGRQPQFTSPTPENSGDFLFARPVLNSSSPATRRNLTIVARRFYGAVCRRGVLVLACDLHLGTGVSSVASDMSRPAWRVRNGKKKPPRAESLAAFLKVFRSFKHSR